MKQREDRYYQMISCRELPVMFLSVCFPVKLSHYTTLFLAYKKAAFETNCFSLTPHVISTRIKKHSSTERNDSY